MVKKAFRKCFEPGRAPSPALELESNNSCLWILEATASLDYIAFNKTSAISEGVWAT
jgi:hypothetical protein